MEKTLKKQKNLRLEDLVADPFKTMIRRSLEDGQIVKSNAIVSGKPKANEKEVKQSWIENGI